MRDAAWRKRVTLKRMRLAASIPTKDGGYRFFPALAIEELRQPGVRKTFTDHA